MPYIYIIHIHTCLHIHLQVINTSTFATVSLEGHTAPVLSVDLDKSGNTVVSSSCDGSVRIWSVETKKQVGASSEVKLSEQTSLHDQIRIFTLWTRLWGLRTRDMIGTRNLDSGSIISAGPDS